VLHPLMLPLFLLVIDRPWTLMVGLRWKLMLQVRHYFCITLPFLGVLPSNLHLLLWWAVIWLSPLAKLYYFFLVSYLSDKAWE
jgi:hypothetical protein